MATRMFAHLQSADAQTYYACMTCSPVSLKCAVQTGNRKRGSATVVSNRVDRRPRAPSNANHAQSMFKDSSDDTLMTLMMSRGPVSPMVDEGSYSLIYSDSSSLSARRTWFWRGEICQLALHTHTHSCTFPVTQAWFGQILVPLIFSVIRSTRGSSSGGSLFLAFKGHPLAVRQAMRDQLTPYVCLPQLLIAHPASRLVSNVPLLRRDLSEDKARRGEARRGEARRGEARRGEARRGEARRGDEAQTQGTARRPHPSQASALYQGHHVPLRCPCPFRPCPWRRPHAGTRPSRRGRLPRTAHP